MPDRIPSLPTTSPRGGPVSRSPAGIGPPHIRATLCLWKKPSPAFFHEGDRRTRPRRGPGWRFLGQHPPHPAADHFMHSLLTKEFSSGGGRWSIDPL